MEDAMRRALVGITNCGASALLKESASQGLWGHHLGPAFARWASSDSTMDLAKLDDLKKLLSPDYKKAVLLDCYASWCEPCKALTPR